MEKTEERIECETPCIDVFISFRVGSGGGGGLTRSDLRLAMYDSLTSAVQSLHLSCPSTVSASHAEEGGGVREAVRMEEAMDLS